MGAFAQVDIPGAQKLLADAGVTGPIDVRLLYAANNPRRSNEYDLMKASAQQAGFNLIDGQSPSWGTLLPTISGYDASLFGWQNTSTGLAESQANYVTTGSNNYGKYTNPEVDTAFDTITGGVLPDEERFKLLSDIEKHLVDDAFGTVIFQFPNVVAWNSTKVDGVSDLSLSPGVLFNYWEWTAP
jgi:peptide/nickel transport system substrate-binding protein